MRNSLAFYLAFLLSSTGFSSGIRVSVEAGTTVRTDTAGESMDLRLGDRPVLRYMYTPFDPNDIEKTKKLFYHVFDPWIGFGSS